jgi:Zn-dependent protease
MLFDEQILLARLTFLIPLILSLSVHEWAHAWAAWRLGDDTARLLGRMTLNPLAHVDPLGTIVLPLLGVPFGWARPVPVNPLRFRGVSMPMGMMLTAAAGPISNIVLAAGAIALLAIAAHLPPDKIPAAAPITQLLEMLVVMNVVLAVFNLIPVPPLDGSRIVAAFVPDRFQGDWDAFGRVAQIALAVLLVASMAMSMSIFSALIRTVSQLLRWGTGG